MGLRLLLLSWWTPTTIIRKELTNVSNQTTTALQTILAYYAPQEVTVYAKQQPLASIKEQRANMAQTHAELVQKLITTLGHNEAVKLGREALFSVGQKLGAQIRCKLGVGDDPKDLIRAAKVLYRVLGIEFDLEWVDISNAVATIHQCALSERYSALTCEVLSATDEGVINGLQPKLTMKFQHYKTSGCKNCRANIHINQKEQT
jgi:hypothetical protein